MGQNLYIKCQNIRVRVINYQQLNIILINDLSEYNLLNLQYLELFIVK